MDIHLPSWNSVLDTINFLTNEAKSHTVSSVNPRIDANLSGRNGVSDQHLINDGPK
jgi:hypothetical protein